MILYSFGSHNWDAIVELTKLNFEILLAIIEHSCPWFLKVPIKNFHHLFLLFEAKLVNVLGLLVIVLDPVFPIENML